MNGMKSEPVEIERKFLIGCPDAAWLHARQGCRVIEIEQVYLTTSDGSEERVRSKLENGQRTLVHTVKRGSGVRREEREEAISPEQYETLLKRADPERGRIVKTRYCLPLGTRTLEIDVYPQWTDCAIAEIELEREDEPFVFPKEIRVIREVTEDPAYKNAALARRIKGQ